MVCANITLIKLTGLELGIFLFWFGMVYKLQLVNYSHKTVLKYTRSSHMATAMAFVYAFPGLAHIVKPHLDY